MKTVLIVGASSGIGRETAALFAKENYKVINLSRTACTLPGVENRLCDVTKREDLDEILSGVKKENLSCLVYSAGFSLSAPLEFVREGDYRYLFEVNFFAFLHILQTLLPALRATGGTACVVGSLAACLPIPFDPYYSASKAALVSLVTTLNLELEGENVHVVCVQPGGTKTGFTDKRKVYSPAEINGYAKPLRLATDSLARTEQKGASPKKVAKTVYSACLYSANSVVTSGLLNKCYRLFSRIFPEKILSSMLKMKYFTEPEA